MKDALKFFTSLELNQNFELPFDIKHIYGVSRKLKETGYLKYYSFIINGKHYEYYKVIKEIDETGIEIIEKTIDDLNKGIERIEGIIEVNRSIAKTRKN